MKKQRKPEEYDSFIRAGLNAGFTDAQINFLEEITLASFTTTEEKCKKCERKPGGLVYTEGDCPIHGKPKEPVEEKPQPADWDEVIDKANTDSLYQAHFSCDCGINHTFHGRVVVWKNKLQEYFDKALTQQREEIAGKVEGLRKETHPSTTFMQSPEKIKVYNQGIDDALALIKGV